MSSYQAFWSRDLTESTTAVIRTIKPCRLELKKVYDHVIIGGGLTGVSFAYHLSKRGESSLLLEAQHLGSGASGRNGGIMWPNPQDPFEVAVATEINDIFGNEISMNFQGGIYHAFKNPVHEIDYSFDDALNKDSRRDIQVASCSSAKLILAMAKASQPLSEFVEGAAVQSISLVEMPEQITTTTVTTTTTVYSLKLETGQEIYCKNVLIACNAWIPKLVPALSPFLAPCTNCVIATSKPVPSHLRWTFGALSIGSGANDIYASMTPDGHIVAGGMRSLDPNFNLGRDNPLEITPNDELTFVKLEETIVKLFPQLLEYKDDVKFDTRWVGVLTTTSDKLPLLGRLPDYLFGPVPEPGSGCGVYLAGGYNGHGMPRCFGASHIVVKILLGEELSSVERYVMEQWDVNRIFPAYS